MPVYGGFWIRVVAYLIDAILLGVVGGVIGAVLGIGFGMGAQLDPETLNEAMLGAQLISLAINLVMGWLYYALMESSANQGTLGKMALGLVVSDMQGNRISFGRATGRYFAKILSSLILLIGYIMIAFTERKQGLHDLIVSTLVTKKGTFTGTGAADVFS
jgi:uncharacterized RDD family membrane protein YckC